MQKSLEERVIKSPSGLYFYCLGRSCMDDSGLFSVTKFATDRGLLDHILVRHNGGMYECCLCMTFWTDVFELKDHYAQKHPDKVAPKRESYFAKIPENKWDEFKRFVRTKTGYTGKNWKPVSITLESGVEKDVKPLKPMQTYPVQNKIEKAEQPPPGIGEGSFFKNCQHCGSQIEKGNRHIMPMVQLVPGPGCQLDVYGQLIDEGECEDGELKISGRIRTGRGMIE